MSNYSCLYCRKSLRPIFGYIPGYIRYDCNNHNYISVSFYINENNNCYAVRLYTVKNKISINSNLEKMYVYKENEYLVLPIDNNLTPENFEVKLKLYFTFQ